MHLNTRRYRHHRTARKYDKTSHRKFSKKKPAFTIVTDRKKHRFGRIKNGDNYFALSTSDYDGGHKLWKFNRLVMTSLLQIRFGAAVFNFRNRRDFRVFLGFRVSFALFSPSRSFRKEKLNLRTRRQVSVQTYGFRYIFNHPAGERRIYGRILRPLVKG